MTQPDPNIIIDPHQYEADAPGKKITLDWTVTFKQEFPIAKPLTQQEFVALAKDQIAWLKEDFLKQLEKYPQTLLAELDKYGCLKRETFQQNGNGK